MTYFFNKNRDKGPNFFKLPIIYIKKLKIILPKGPHFLWADPDIRDHVFSIEIK